MGGTAAENYGTDSRGTAKPQTCAVCGRPLHWAWALLADGRVVHLHCRDAATVAELRREGAA
jgi:hypothetical protein